MCDILIVCEDIESFKWDCLAFWPGDEMRVRVCEVHRGVYRCRFEGMDVYGISRRHQLRYLDGRMFDKVLLGSPGEIELWKECVRLFKRRVSVEQEYVPSGERVLDWDERVDLFVKRLLNLSV